MENNKDQRQSSQQHFRVHGVAVADATAPATHPTLEHQGLMKFVLQESVGVTSATEESDSPKSSLWRTLSFKEVAALWRANPSFVEMFAASLAAVPFEAMFWESVPVTRSTMDKPYEYVTADSSYLAAVSMDGSAFAEHLASGEGTNNVVSFRNIRKDARLVAPCRGGQAGVNYAHLAAFVRSAPQEQVVKFFCAVGAALEEEVASREDEHPVWLSTSGLGVYWLHARLDSVPKYYSHTPYKTV